jgi:tetratricopeptide (TPR) repeat protein
MKFFRLLCLCLILGGAVWVSSEWRLQILAEESAEGEASLELVAPERGASSGGKKTRLSLGKEGNSSTELRLAVPPSNYPRDAADIDLIEPDSEPDAEAPKSIKPDTTSQDQEVEQTSEDEPEVDHADEASASPSDDMPADHAQQDTQEADADSSAGQAGSSDIVIEAATFKGVTPGQSTREQLLEAWGDPQETKKLGAATRHTFKVEPFSKITATLVGGTVVSLVIHLDKPFEPKQLADELQLDLQESVLVPDAAGKILGHAFPERGVLFGYGESADKQLVSQMVLEPIEPQTFALRAERHRLSHTKKALVDIDYALSMDEKRSSAHLTHARVLKAHGRLTAAIQAAQHAAQLDPKSATAQLLIAELLANSADYSEALRTIDRLLQTEKVSTLEKAQAYLQWGDCLSLGPSPDFEQAMKHHMQAIRLVQSSTVEEQQSVPAKHVLLGAYLGVAGDIGAGRWQRKQQVVPQWNQRAELVARDLVEQHGEDTELLLQTFVGSIRAVAEIGVPPDATQLCQRTSELGHELVEKSDDPARKQRLQWELGLAMASAAQISLARSKHDEAFTYGEVATEYLTHGAEHGKAWPTYSWVLGRLAYRLGAVCAIQQSDHTRAVSWYAKAIPLLENPQPRCALIEPSKHGEMFVSMAVSYWQAADRPEAVRLTEQGVKLMEQAVDEGLVSKAALAIPYANLSSMHQEIGNAQQARSFADLAAKLEPQQK